MKKDVRLSEIQSDILHLTEKGYHALCRGKQGISAVFKNKLWLHEVHKLRFFLLMEADFNFLNKLIIGVRMINMIDKAKLNSMDQYGEHKGHIAI